MLRCVVRADGLEGEGEQAIGGSLPDGWERCTATAAHNTQHQHITPTHSDNVHTAGRSVVTTVTDADDSPVDAALAYTCRLVES